MHKNGYKEARDSLLKEFVDLVNEMSFKVNLKTAQA